MKRIFLLILIIFMTFRLASETSDIGEVVELYKKNERAQAFELAQRIFGSDLYLESEKYTLMGFLSDIYASEKNYTEAIMYANRMIEMNPKLDKGYYLKGLSLWYLHDYISACDNLSEAIELSPDKPQYHLTRAYIKYDLFKECHIHEKRIVKNGDFYSDVFSIMEDFYEEIRIDNMNYIAIYEIGFLLGAYMDEKTEEGRKMIQGGIECLNAAIKIKPNFIDSYFVLALIYGSEMNYNLELAYYNANKYIESLEAAKNNQSIQLEKSQEFDSSLHMMYTIRGDYYREKKEYELAIKDYDTAISLKPREDINYFNKIRVYQKLRKKAKKSEKKKYDELIEENENLIRENNWYFYGYMKDSYYNSYRDREIDKKEKSRRRLIHVIHGWNQIYDSNGNLISRTYHDKNGGKIEIN